MKSDRAIQSPQENAGIYGDLREFGKVALKNDCDFLPYVNRFLKVRESPDPCISCSDFSGWKIIINQLWLRQLQIIFLLQTEISF